MFIGEPSEEQREEWTRLQMRGEAFMAQLQRFISEIEFDDLEMLHGVFGHISGSADSRAIANWYEGMMTGALAVRKVRLGESQKDNPESLTAL